MVYRCIVNITITIIIIIIVIIIIIITLKMKSPISLGRVVPLLKQCR